MPITDTSSTSAPARGAAPAVSSFTENTPRGHRGQHDAVVTRHQPNDSPSGGTGIAPEGPSLLPKRDHAFRDRSAQPRLPAGTRHDTGGSGPHCGGRGHSWERTSPAREIDRKDFACGRLDGHHDVSSARRTPGCAAGLVTGAQRRDPLPLAIRLVEGGPSHPWRKSDPGGRCPCDYCSGVPGTADPLHGRPQRDTGALLHAERW